MSIEQPENLTPEIVVASVQPAIFAQQERMNPTGSKEFQTYFRERVAVETALATQARIKRAEHWRYMDGLYTDGSFRKASLSEKTRPTDELGGDERILNVQVKELLAQKKRQGIDKPVVLVDFGGGLGLSMMRIAKENRSAIENGDLVVVVTNLAYLPTEETDSKGYSGIARFMEASNDPSTYDATDYTDEELEFAQNNQALVTYLDTTASELATKTIMPKGKRQMPLAGAVDIIYESLSITHTHAPDVALAVFGNLLSEQGTLYLETNNAISMRHLQGENRSIRLADGRIINLSAKPYDDSKGEALEVGINLLQTSYDMKKSFENDHYSIFMKPKATPFSTIAAQLD